MLRISNILDAVVCTPLLNSARIGSGAEAVKVLVDEYCTVRPWRSPLRALGRPDSRVSGTSFTLAGLGSCL